LGKRANIVGVPRFRQVAAQVRHSIAADESKFKINRQVAALSRANSGVSSAFLFTFARRYCDPSSLFVGLFVCSLTSGTDWQVSGGRARQACRRAIIAAAALQPLGTGGGIRHTTAELMNAGSSVLLLSLISYFLFFSAQSPRSLRRSSPNFEQARNQRGGIGTGGRPPSVGKMCKRSA